MLRNFPKIPNPKPPLQIHSSSLLFLSIPLMASSSSSAHIKIVAEYAKSNRSTCKNCSQTISSKSLRLGVVTKDLRGYDATKWHHLNCFSQPIGSVQEITGFELLQSDDQEALKTFAATGATASENCPPPVESDDQEALKTFAAATSESCPPPIEGNDGTKVVVEVTEKKTRKESKTCKGDEIGNAEPEERSSKKLKGPSPSQTEIVAEYAKSNRSSCKKCSNSIPAKSLRLGLKSRDPRGYDATKWHHLNCFPIDSQPINSMDAINGFSLLKGDDQEALTKFVEACEQLPKEACKADDIGDDTEREERNSKKLKLLPCEEPELRITLSTSDLKNNYKDATLLPKWKAFQTVIFLERDEGLHDSSKIAAFDFDGCLAKTSVKSVGPNAWSLLYPSIPEKLKRLYDDGYKLVIFTNEANIELWKNKRQVAVDSKIGRLNNFIKRVNVPIQVFIACGHRKTNGQAEDPFRKPKPGMWRIMEQHFNSGISIDMDQSFYVGDAAGRDDDHSDADIKFAQAVGVKFFVPEDYFTL